jgi:ribosomal protein S18 acetylase RimI-like enzyme
MNVLLRAAAQEDYDAVCMLLAQGDHFHAEALPQIFRPIEGPARSREYFERILANENAAIFVAEQQGTLIGMIQCDVRTAPDVPIVVPRHFVYIDNLVVSERFRHQGVGLALVERVHQWTREKGLTEVELGVWEFNTSARILYEKLGYQTTRRIMSKRL